jgi:chaperonin GroEL
MKDNLHFSAQDKLKAGIDKVAQAVGSTMGTGGNNAIIEAIEAPGYLTTNDGYSIANAVHLADPIENLGKQILLESINRANKSSGDGSSTTCVTTAAIIEEGLKYTKDHHPMDIKRSLEYCIPLIEESLDLQTQHIYEKGVMDIIRLKQVATISAEDKEIGDTIGEIYAQIGHKGIVYWDVSKTGSDHYTIGSGITVEGATYASPYMCDATETGQNTNQIRIKNPYILLTKQKIASSSDFNSIAQKLFEKEVKDIVVFADDFEPLIINDLILTRAKKGFRIVLVKMPVLFKDVWFEDLALATGAKVVDATAGFPLKDLSIEHLGTVKNIIIDKQDTFLDGINDVSEHIKALEEDNTEESDLRVARLNTKTARYFVGAQTESALSYRRLKVEDAIAAAFQALNGGIVAGGGVALLNTIQVLPITIGGKILSTALTAPLRTICDNSGIENTPEIGGTIGFNTKTRELVDMFEAGIVDPKNVVLNAVKNAVSVAATVLTAPTIVLLPRMEMPQQEQQSLIQR